MKCPSCGFVQSDEVKRCKKCDFDLEAFRRGEKPPKPGWFKRLAQRKETPAVVERTIPAEPTSPIRETAARPPEPPPVRPRSFPEKKPSRRAPDAGGQVTVQLQLTALDEEKKKLRLRLEDFEIRQRQQATELQRQLETEKQIAREEREKAQRIQEQMQSELAEVRQTKQQLLAELQEAQEAKRRVQTEMEEARRRQSALDAELESARKIRRQTEAQLKEKKDEHEAMLQRSSQLEAERLAELKKLMAERTAALEEQNGKIAEMEGERLRIAEAARELQAERQRLEDARRTMERRQSLQEQESQAATEAQAHRIETAATPAPVEENQGKPSGEEDQIPSWQIEHRLAKGGPTARAEDLLDLLGRKEPRPKPAAHAAAEPPHVQATPTSVELEEVWDDADQEETAEDDEAPPMPFARINPSAGRHKHFIPPKGGLIFRLAAAAIDLVIVLAAVGIFALVGWLISGANLDPLRTIVRLGWAFNVLFVLLAAGYFTYMHGAYGQTLGKRLLGLKVLTTHGKELGFLTAFFRFTMACFAAAGLGIGILWMGLDANKQGWHDKLSRTVVLRG